MNFLLNVKLSEIFSDFFTSIKNSFVNFSAFDAIDILIIATVIFFLSRSLKAKRAGALLIGISVVVILTAISYIFKDQLSATYFIFSRIFNVGVLVLVIIFQPEIREALEKLGSGSLTGIMPFSDQKKKKIAFSQTIDQICTAVTHLSTNKTGALIVISRTIRLDEVIETGITINADVNAFLLRNIFFNNAPLHDGAVIIEDAKIHAAGCLLPLTKRTDIDGDLGTRHRAAIGMSETSDAIVIVVSEETGIISVAYDSLLTRNYSYDTLRRFLQKNVLRLTQNDSEKRG